MAVDFRLFYVSDGTSVTEMICNKFSGRRYNMVIEKYDLKRRSSSLSGSLSHCSNSPLRPEMTVFLVTPGMVDCLKNDDGDFAHILDYEDKPVVALCLQVPEETVKALTGQIFQDPSIQWEYLDVGDTTKTFHYCMIELHSILDHQHEPMQIPTLKKCHLLPASPVMAGDIVYIFLESNIDNIDGSYSHLIVSGDNFRLRAEKIGDHLYEFVAPACSQSKLSIEISSRDGQMFGTEEIIYKDKRELLVSILNDIVNPIEFMTEALQINDKCPEALDGHLAEWFGYKDNQTHQTDLQSYIEQWINSISFRKGLSNLELPTLLHLAAKYNFAILTQTLLMQPWASMALKMKNKDGLTPYHLAIKYRHEVLSQYLATGSEVEQASPELEEDFCMKPDYCSPDNDILLLDSIPQQRIFLDISLDSSGMVNNIAENNTKLRQNAKVQPLPSCKMMQECSRECSGYMNMTSSSGSRLLQRSFSTQPNSDKKTVIHGRQYSLDSSGIKQRSPGQNAISPPNLLQRGVLDRSTLMFHKSSDERPPTPPSRSPISQKLSGCSTGGMPPTPPRQAQFEHHNQVKIMNQPDMQKQNAHSQISKNGYYSKKGSKVDLGRLRRTSMTASQFLMPTPNLLKSSLSMSRINEVSLVEEFIPPHSRANARPKDGQQSKHQVLSNSPKPCYPASPVPPPLPVTQPPPLTSVAPSKSRLSMSPANNNAPPIPQKAPILPEEDRHVHIRQMELKTYMKGKNTMVSPDHSQPIDLHFPDHLARRDFHEHKTTKDDDLNESIYEEVDSPEMGIIDEEQGQLLRGNTSILRESLRRRGLLENESTNEALKQLQSEHAKEELSPTNQADKSQLTQTPSPSSSTPSPKGEHIKSSPSIFSALTSKFSRNRTKPYRSSKDHVTKM